MPESNRPLVERIARVLAGAAHSVNANGSDPARRRQGGPRLARTCATTRSPSSTPRASPTKPWPRRGTKVWRNMVEAALAQHVD